PTGYGKGSEPNGVDFRPKLQPGKGLAKMACLARLRVTTLPDRKEAIHGSCYPHAPQPPSPPPPPATRPSPGAALRRPPRRRPSRAGPAGGAGHLPRPPVLAAGHALGLPLPGARPRPLLPRRRRPLPRLARRPRAGPLLGRPRRLLQSPRPPARGHPGPAHPRHRPAPPGAGPGRVALGGAHAAGPTVPIPDPPATQKASPQARPQRPGVGFPIARLVVLFSLAVGTVLDAALGPYQGKQTGETALFHALRHHLEPGDILLADRY